MKPPDERGRSPEHVEGLETLRYAEAALYRFQNHHRIADGWSAERFATEPEFVALVEARDDARKAARLADPKWARA